MCKRFRKAFLLAWENELLGRCHIPRRKVFGMSQIQIKDKYSLNWQWKKKYWVLPFWFLCLRRCHTGGRCSPLELVSAFKGHHQESFPHYSNQEIWLLRHGNLRQVYNRCTDGDLFLFGFACAFNVANCLSAWGAVQNALTYFACSPQTCVPAVGNIFCGLLHTSPISFDLPSSPQLLF